MSTDQFRVSAFGVTSPGIIYGTAWKKARTEELVSKAIQLGFRGIDTACQPKHYDEAGVGAAIAASLSQSLTRADLYVQTKFTPVSGQDPQQIPYDPQAHLADQVTQSFYASVLNLQTSYLDCMVLHSPLALFDETMEVWEALETLFDSGRVRQLGISNCYRLSTLQALHENARVKPAVVQNRFYAETSYDREIREFCRQHDIEYQSFWTLTANPHLLGDSRVKALAAKYQRTPAQVLFRYLTQEGVTPLTGTKSEAHMREDLEIFGFDLTKPEREELDALL